MEIFFILLGVFRAKKITKNPLAVHIKNYNTPKKMSGYAIDTPSSRAPIPL